MKKYTILALESEVDGSSEQESPMDVLPTFEPSTLDKKFSLDPPGFYEKKNVNYDDDSDDLYELYKEIDDIDNVIEGHIEEVGFAEINNNKDNNA
jgi:hypothetical protein